MRATTEALSGSSRSGLAGSRLAAEGGADDDELAAGDQGVEDLDGLGEQAAGVVAQVEHDALEAFSCLWGQVLEGGADLLAAVLLEGDELEVGDLAGEELGDDALDLDDLAGDREGQGLVAAADLDDSPWCRWDRAGSAGPRRRGG
jgi:hypothetical protein